MPSNHQSKRIPVGHKPRNADEHQCASFIAYPIALAAEAPPSCQLDDTSFPTNPLYGSGQRSYNFQHVRVASWKSSGQTRLDGVALLRQTHSGSLPPQLTLPPPLPDMRSSP